MFCLEAPCERGEHRGRAVFFFLNRLCFGSLFVESIKAKIKTTAMGILVGDKYVHHLDYGDVFMGVYVCQNLSEKLYQIVHFKYVHFVVH